MPYDDNDIEASVIDQRVLGIVEKYPTLLADYGDMPRKKPAAFLLLVMSIVRNTSIEEAAKDLTDGGSDAGIDGIHVGDIDDGEFLVTLFQGKYSSSLSGKKSFPENGVEKAIGSLQILFDPSRQVDLNPRIRPVVEEVRSLIKDGYIPSVRIILCNNGKKWDSSAEARIEDAKNYFKDKVDFIYVNHSELLKQMQKSKGINAQLRLSGLSLVENMNFMRVMIGRIAVKELAALLEKNGDNILQKNIRRYLGLNTNRVNLAIHDALIDPQKAQNFYFYNNGITAICEKFNYNAFEQNDHIVKVSNLQIINGGQTCKTIQETLKNTQEAGTNAYVMIRIYELDESQHDLVRAITYATNSQNPVDLRDLHSNDELQKRLEAGIHELGYNRVGGLPLFEKPSSHTTVRTVRYTAVR